MDAMGGSVERGDSTPPAGVENPMLRFTPYAEDWSKPPVIVSGESSYVTDDKGRTYIDGLDGARTADRGGLLSGGAPDCGGGAVTPRVRTRARGGGG